MGFSKMKAGLFCFALITMLLMNQVDAGRTSTIHEVEGALDPCKAPGGPHPACHPDGNSRSLQEEANPYHRGCSKFHRCRKGNDN
ncbi:hypothetical protein DITRI_Ditri11bG0060200 [Diplodiscus trichospermus]